MAVELSAIVQTMDSVYGMDLSFYDDSFLMRTTEKRCAAVESKEISDYIKYLSTNKSEAQDLFRSLNITYTEFFRNPLTFAHLEQWILPRLIEEKSGNNELRVWSAGCSSGQEAYSIAMLIEKCRANKQKALRYRIIATDISQSALAAAKKGEYTEDAVQNIRLKDLKEFFVESGQRYVVCERLKKNVNFSTYDLLDNLSAHPQESIFGNFDLIICSNVLLYYKPDCQRFIMAKLTGALSDHSYLVTGEAESHSFAKLGGLHPVAPPSPIFQKS